MTNPLIAPSGPCQPCSPGVPLASVSELGRRLEGRRSKPPATPVLPKKDPSSNSGHPSDLARRLARAYRSANARGLDRSEIAISHTKLIEQWLAVQSAAADAALTSAEEIPSIRLEQEFVDALAALRVDRVAVYGTKLTLFEDTEALTDAVKAYAAALRAPHDNRCKLWQALARRSMACNPAELATKSEILLARRALSLAREGISRKTLEACGQRINRARATMTAAHARLDGAYHITKIGPIEPGPFGPFPAEGGGQRQSGSNRRELKPRSPRSGMSGSMGMRH